MCSSDLRPDEHLGEGIGHGAGPTPTTTQCGPACGDGRLVTAAHIVGGLRHQVFERPEVVGGGRERQLGPIGDGSVADSIEPAFEKERSGRLDEPGTPAHSLRGRR